MRLDFNFMKFQEQEDIRAKKKHVPPLAPMSASKTDRYKSAIPWILHKLDHDFDNPAVALFQLVFIQARMFL